MPFELRWTGHPFIDVGLATLAAMAGKHQLSMLDEQDFRSAAGKLKFWYSQHHAARNYISTVFTNSHFTQPSMSQEQREAYADRYLFAFVHDHLPEMGETKCVFFPELAAVEVAYRQHIPLLNGEDIGNFSSLGRDGLPVSGLALLAVHALPFGCLKCGGRLLGFHQQAAEGTAVMQMALTGAIYDQNMRALAMLPPDEKSKYPDFGGKPKLRYVDQLIKTRQRLSDRRANLDYITGYYFSNYGAGAEIEILRLDHTVLSFVNRAQLDANSAWNQAVALNWVRKKQEELEPDDETRIAGGRRNLLYERLFQLPDNALAFLTCIRGVHDWYLIELFLEEVMAMDQQRIDTYRRLGDLLAKYALDRDMENQPLSFYIRFSRARSYTMLRGIIRSAAEQIYRMGGDTLLFTYDDFIAAFEHPSERTHNWWLARDLISIRLLEQLHKAKVDFSQIEQEQPGSTAHDDEEE